MQEDQAPDIAMMSSRQQRLTDRMTSGSEAVARWRDWKWQLKHAITTIEAFERVLGVRIDAKRRKKLELAVARFPLSITPYYASLIDTSDLENSPIFRQAFPSPAELQIERYDMRDPLGEERDSPVPGITHRYPDRVLFWVTGVCAMYCRHCTRKRKTGDKDLPLSKAALRKAIDYIRKTPAVRDVLISGGDPLLLSDERLDWILGELRTIKHVEVIRIGTRVPVVLPYRVTDDLVAMLKKHHPLWINTQFNHPREITQSSREALAKLADVGIPLGNQSVLLAGVNDCPRIIRSLVHKLVMNRVRPYYIYQCDLSEGLAHFRTPIGKGIEIMESLIGHTSGFAVPAYVVDAPGGGGKIRLNPNYLLSWSTNKVVLRNYEGVITTYKEPDSYEANFCDRECDECELQLKLEDGDEWRAVGIEKLLADFDSTISLTPEGSGRRECG
ncbi:MAG: lysine 2,3-aminomutase [Deltaproteobacteria bacterium]|nr:lysine 2,3-aminomutase [Deltaproteobacteria bacterium]